MTTGFPRRSESDTVSPLSLVRTKSGAGLPSSITWILPVAFAADANGASHRRIPRARHDVGCRRARGPRLLPAARASRHRHAPAGPRADGARGASRARAAAAVGSPPRAAPAPLPLRLAVPPRRARPLALRPGRPARPARLVRGGYPGGRSARRAGVHDRNLMRGFFSRMNPTLRGFLIILAVVAVIVVLQLQTTLVALLLVARIAFVLAIAF